MRCHGADRKTGCRAFEESEAPEKSHRDGVRIWQKLRGALVFVERLIRAGHHGFWLVPRRVFLPTNGIPDGQFAAFPDHLEWPQASQNKLQLRVVAFGKNQEKLIAAHAGSEIAAANGSIETRGEFLENEVSGRMAVGIVDVLEVIQVHQDDRERMALASGTSDLGGKALLGEPAVVKSRQGVNHGELAQDQRVMLFLSKLAAETFDEHLLIDGVNVEKND